MKLFKFEFSDSDYEEKGHEEEPMVFFFELNADPGKDYQDEDEDDYLEFLGDIESDYGVHDFCSTGSLDGSYQEVIAFGSYEVKFAQWGELVQKWHDWMASEGWQPGAIGSLSLRDFHERFYTWCEYRED